MPNFKVIEVIDGDTFRVSPRWRWHNKSGDLVRPVGYDVPEKGQIGYNAARQKLTNLIELC